MTNTLIISEAKVRQFTDINESLDDSLIKNAVREAQDIDLQRILGTLLYDKIMNDIDADTLTGAYKTLVDSYIQDFLLYAAYYYTLENVFVRPRNNGLLTPQGGDNSATVDKTMYDTKRQSVDNKKQFYADRLVRYLIENENTYPELGENTLLYQMSPDYGTQYRSSIVFTDNTRGKYIDFARQAGLPIVDSAYKQYPPKNYN